MVFLSRTLLLHLDSTTLDSPVVILRYVGVFLSARSPRSLPPARPRTAFTWSVRPRRRWIRTTKVVTHHMLGWTFRYPETHDLPIL